MKILLTGSTGYIGRRLLTELLRNGHHIICLVRDRRRFDWEDFSETQLKQLEVVECDLQKDATLEVLPREIDIAYYLVHSMSSSYDRFMDAEALSANNFVRYISQTNARQIVYLSGIVNDADLSDHLLSRRQVEDILKTSTVPVTVLRAAIIIGSGSASFEIIRDLVEKLPIMIAPKWLSTRCQPISIRNVIDYLLGVIDRPETYGRSFDIGGTDVLTYKEMLLGFARERGLRRWIITVPVLTPKLSSLWLVFVTSTPYSLARALVNSLRNEVVCRDASLQQLIPVQLLSYQQSLQIAFNRIREKNIVSSWKDAISRATLANDFLDKTEVPRHGVFIDRQEIAIQNPQQVLNRIWRIGGDNGWYVGNFLWRLRGLVDKLIGGVGLRRGRRNPDDLKTGDALDFWRVLVADREEGRLLLFAEMKLPGEAWLEFRIQTRDAQTWLLQTATFRPLGVWGRLYWYSVLPFHQFIFPALVRKIAQDTTN
jgi:uncharacterized protein YbjT (DUF2867 family)